VVKDFIKEGTLYAAAIGAAKGVSLFFVPIFTYYFSTQDFGAIEIFHIISVLTIGLFSWQAGQGVVRYISTYQNQKQRKKYLASTALISITISLLLGSALLIANKKPILNFMGLDNPVFEKTFLLAVASTFLNGLIAFFASHQQALRKKLPYALALFAHAFIGIIATFIYVIVLDKSINGFFYATITIAPFIIMFQLYSLRAEYEIGFSPDLFKKLINFSVPLVPAAVALILLSISDRVILNYLTSTATLGIYSIALKFAFGFQLIVQGYATAIQPLIFEKYHDNKTPEKMALMLKGYVVFGAIAVIILSVFSRETIILFTQQPYYSAYLVLPMLYCTAWIHGLIMFTPGMQIKEKTKMISAITLMAVALNISLNFFLIPAFDIKGAALASLLSSVFYAIVMRFYSQRYFFIQVSPKIWFTILIVLALTLITSTSNFERIFVHVELHHKIASFIVFCALILFFSRGKLKLLKI
jgi:O-antigen/teichoic acid export membrane protein